MPRASSGPSLPPPALTPSRRVRAPSWTSGVRVRPISTMRGFEEWALTAEEDHPLRCAFVAAQDALHVERSRPADKTKSLLQKVVREKGTLLKMSSAILFEFCEKLIAEVASKVRVDLPSDEEEAREVLDLAIARTREAWKRSTESLATVRTSRGRPPSLAIESLEILCEEIVRSPLVSKRMKGRAQRVISAWASRVAQRPLKWALRGIQRVRQKSHRGR